MIDRDLRAFPGMADRNRGVCFIAATIAAVATVGSAVISSNGAKSAANDQANAARNAQQTQLARVVPEFDMPGHSTAWFAAYPELASAPGPYRIERGFGVFDPCMDPSRERVFQFLDAFIGEMAALFPDEYFHTGGDEVNGKDWDRSPRIRQFKRARGLKTDEDLQAYFSKRVHAIVMAHGKKVIGWDEILDPKLPKGSVVQAWRGPRILADAARRGYPVILSVGYYLDLLQPAAFHYGNDPLGGEAAALGAGERSRVLGGEACQWAELISGENADLRIWPRMAAIAERLWSGSDVTDVGSMYRRLESASVRLEYLGLTHRSVQGPMLDRIAAGQPAGALRTLGAALEPVKGYARHAARAYKSSTPLNRMVDATPPESGAAREFSGAVDALLAGDQAQREGVRTRLAGWRDQYEALKPVFAASSLAAELEPVSRDVSALAAAGIEALDAHLWTYRDDGFLPHGTWRERLKDTSNSLTRIWAHFQRIDAHRPRPPKRSREGFQPTAWASARFSHSLMRADFLMESPQYSTKRASSSRSAASRISSSMS